MEIEVEQRRENKLLGREEIYFRIKYDASTPSRKKVKENLKNTLGLKGFIILQYVKPVFGSREARGYAKIYESEKKARQIESSYITKRNVGGGEKAKESKKEVKEVKEKQEAKEKQKEVKEVKEKQEAKESKKEVKEAKEGKNE